MNTYLEIIAIEGAEVVRRINVTGQSERSIERSERGMLMNTDTSRFFVNTNETEETLESI